MLQRLGHIFLAGLLFISSTGLLITQHFCQDTLKSAAIFAKAESCGHGDAVVQCPMHGLMVVGGDHDNGCCDDESTFEKMDADQISVSTDLNLNDHPALLATLLVVLQWELPVLERSPVHYLNYKPPLIVRDLPVRLQAFLC